MALRLAPLPHIEVVLDPRRTFTPAQKAKMFERANGRCEVPGCGKKIRGTWTAGHYPIAHAMGGRTVLDNARVECSDCSPITAAADTTTAAKVKRLRKETGRHKPGAKVKKIRNRKFPSKEERRAERKRYLDACKKTEAVR